MTTAPGINVSEPAAAVLPALVDELAAGTGIAHWTGGVGLGVCAGGEEVYDRPAAAVLTAAVPETAFRIFASTGDPAADLPRHHGRWIETTQPILALVHADPRCPDLLRATVDAGTASGAFLVGGLVSHRTGASLVAKSAGSNDYYHLARAADDQAPKDLQQRDWFRQYQEKTRMVAGGQVEVLPLEVIAETAVPA